MRDPVAPAPHGSRAGSPVVASGRPFTPSERATYATGGVHVVPPASRARGATRALVVVTVLGIVAALAAALHGCGPPAPDPAWPTLPVYFDTAFSAADRADGAAAALGLQALGPAFPATTDRASARVVVVAWVSDTGCAAAAGYWDAHGPDPRVVYVDRTCAAGATAWRALVAHEIAHAALVGACHVCRLNETGADCCTTDARPALMHRSPFEGDPDVGPVAQDTPTVVDAELFRLRHPTPGPL